MLSLTLAINVGARSRLGWVVQVRQVRIWKLTEVVYETGHCVLELPRLVDAGMCLSEMPPDSMAFGGIPQLQIVQIV
jgi:hypothetical protein